jgi:hypothetical protein
MSKSKPTKSSNIAKDAIISKKKKEKRDYFLLELPWKSSSMKMKIANKIIALLRQNSLLREKDIILKLISEDTELKKYYLQSKSVSIFRYVIWYLTKKKIIYKAKILGDDKHVYYFLPEQLTKLSSNILLYPTNYTPVTSKNTNVNSSSTNTSRKKEELEEEWEEEGEEEEEKKEEEWEDEEEEEEDEWFEECIKNNDEC